ncbi:MAG: PhoH family protein [Flavobacteriales bacterium]|nr:PhoH family protein [Flavobacteriales bacterium]MCB9364528.1 PhoH family protein [Flavobacteriales bacterium]
MAKKKSSRIYVLDTSVILYDHNAIHNFEDNDIAIPITVLEELDNFKKGNDTKNFSAREFIRFLDKISGHNTLQKWVNLNGPEKGKFKIIMHHEKTRRDAEFIFDDNKADHKILNAAISLQEEYPEREVVMVTKDVNLRLKAKALDLPSEDYLTGKIEDVKGLVVTGKKVVENVDPEMIKKIFNGGAIENPEIKGMEFEKNFFYILRNGKSSALSFYNPINQSLERVEKEYVYGIKPKNAEQAFAIHALLNNNIKLVALQGVAGTGKTLLALASSIEQRNQYKQIILARPIVPLSNRDIGYLPGDANDKIGPYMEPLWDNLKFIKNQFGENEKKHKLIEDMENDERIKITPLAYIRGRSLSDVYFIVDEAQNLTPHEVKTIITRAGENTKIVFTGDVNQIDSPYLDEQSNGLSYLIDRLKGHELFAHITLEKGERSELANLANDML